MRRCRKNRALRLNRRSLRPGRGGCGSQAAAVVCGRLRLAGGGGCMRRLAVRGLRLCTAGCGSRVAAVVCGGLRFADCVCARQAAARGWRRLYAAGFGLRTAALGRLAGGGGYRVVRRDGDPRPCFRGARRRRFVGILRINLFLPAAFRIFDKSFRGRSRSVARGSALRRTGGRRSEMV